MSYLSSRLMIDSSTYRAMAAAKPGRPITTTNATVAITCKYCAQFCLREDKLCIFNENMRSLHTINSDTRVIVEEQVTDAEYEEI